MEDFFVLQYIRRRFTLIRATLISSISCFWWTHVAGNLLRVCWIFIIFKKALKYAKYHQSKTLNFVIKHFYIFAPLTAKFSTAFPTWYPISQNIWQTPTTHPKLPSLYSLHKIKTKVLTLSGLRIGRRNTAVLHHRLHLM